jgi:hypothetical protein
VGRRAISEELATNDGVVRGLFERLAEQNLVEVGPAGVALSKKGKILLRKILKDLLVVQLGYFENLQLIPGQTAVVAHLSQSSATELNGIMQRDEAIKAGAHGAITLTVREGRLRIPPDGKTVESVAVRDNRKFLEVFKLEENDVIMIGFGDSTGQALAGTIAGIFSL